MGLGEEEAEDDAGPAEIHVGAGHLAALLDADEEVLDELLLAAVQGGGPGLGAHVVAELRVEGNHGAFDLRRWFRSGKGGRGLFKGECG